MSQINDTNEPDLSYKDVVLKIKDIYCSREYILLRRKLSDETYLNSISKGNSETVYSSFIHWIFRQNNFHSLPDSPLLNILRLLACNAYEQCDEGKTNLNNLFDSELSKLVLTNEIGICDVEATKEVPTYADDANGRIDIVVTFNVFSLSDKNYRKKCRILIENKVYSAEHDKQCKKYYEHFSKPENKNGSEIDIYCFLSIEKPDSLSDNTHYVKIDYQELLDCVLNPLVVNGQTLTTTQVNYLNDFIKTITSIKTDGKLQIAMDNETKELLERFYANNSDIIRAAILQSDDDEIKEAVKKSSREKKSYQLDFLDEGTQLPVTGLTNMVCLVIEYIAKTNPSGYIIDLFKKLGKKYSSKYLASTNKQDYVGGKGDKRYLTSGQNDHIKCSDGVNIYVSSQFVATPNASNNNIDRFVKLINNNQKTLGVKITPLQ